MQITFNIIGSYIKKVPLRDATFKVDKLTSKRVDK